MDAQRSHEHQTGFRHEALYYDGPSDFAARVGPFVADGLAAGEPVMVMTPPDRIEALQDYLGSDARRVRFADMTVVGRNPARIIPAWRDFADEHSGERARGVGEPIWAGRSSDELEECRIHESMLNLAFATAAGFWLACPYDRASLEGAVLEGSHRTHPLGDGVPFPAYGEIPSAATLLAPMLPPPPPDAPVLRYSADNVRAVRHFAADQAAASGLGTDTADNFALAAHELAINSILHGGGSGTIHIWETAATVIGHVRDDGLIEDPLVGRVRPGADYESGRGVWLANQLCDLVQVRSGTDGTSVRFHMVRT